MKTAKVNQAYVDTFHIGWRLGPRLNASGRIADASVSFDLLMSDDAEEAQDIADRIERMNNERKALTDEVRSYAELQAKSAGHKDDAVHVLWGDAWNAGVVGIVASNMKETCARPAIVVSFENGMGKGSGRSIPGFNILEALEHCGKYLEGFGGHARACGIEIKKEKIEEFRAAINEFARPRLKPEDLTPVLEIDGSVSFFEITDAVAEMLASFAPFGEGNREPLLASYNVRLKNVTDFYTAQKTLWFEQSNDHATRVLPARIFKNNPLLNTLKSGEWYDIVFAVQYEQRNSAGTVALQLKDIRKAQREP
jgi:single-stranded-DNA-specific exonuclease